MILAGVLLILAAYLLEVPILYTVGVILVVFGAAFWILGSMGRAIGPRRHYW